MLDIHLVTNRMNGLRTSLDGELEAFFLQTLLQRRYETLYIGISLGLFLIQRMSDVLILTPVEYNYVPDYELLHLLYIQWCAKEAMYKACNVAKYDYQHTYTLPDYHFDGNMQGKANGKVILDDGSVKELIVNYFEIEGCVCCVAY